MHCKWLRQRCRTDFILIAVEFWGSSKKYQCLSRLIKRCKPWQRKGRVKEVRALTPPGWNVDVIITCRATARITMANKRVPDHRLADSICIWPPCSLPCKSSHSRMQNSTRQYSTAKILYINWIEVWWNCLLHLEIFWWNSWENLHIRADTPKICGFCCRTTGTTQMQSS